LAASKTSLWEIFDELDPYFSIQKQPTPFKAVTMLKTIKRHSKNSENFQATANHLGEVT
jgi:hypothetical protein